MDDVIRLTRGIHHFVRGELRFDEELELLKEVVESEKWLNHLEMELMLQEMAQKNQISDSTVTIKNDDRRWRNRQSARMNGAESNYSA